MNFFKGERVVGLTDFTKYSLRNVRTNFGGEGGGGEGLKYFLE